MVRRTTLWNRALTVAIIALVAAGTAWLFVPRPIEVDLAPVVRGPLTVTVEEDGKTRVKERFVVSAPLAGRMSRIALRAGDPVAAGETLLAEIKPSDPALLDARATAEAEARVRAAEAAHERAGAELRRAHEAETLAGHQFERASRLIRSNAISREELDTAEHSARQATESLHAAEFGLKVAEFEVQLAQAALVRTRPSQSAETELPVLQILSPITGQALRIMQESARVVAPGTEIMEIGDLVALEAEIDVLSADATQIAPGAEVTFRRWGGQQPLRGRVRRVEPAGFTKVSALGIEEQRVNVLVDFIDPLDQRRSLGDGYRVEASIVTWQNADALKAPAGALFRRHGTWTVFVARGSRAELREVEIGHNNGIDAEVLGGLNEGESVILFPSDRIVDRVKIRPRSGDSVDARAPR